MSQVNHDSSSSSSTPSPRQLSTYSTDVRSPTVASSFSQADTVLTSRTHYTVNTGGRARQSWRNGINGFWRTPSFLSTENGRSAARRSNSIAGDGTEKAVSPISDAPLVDVPAIELPASPVAGHGEPRSFFESDSESDEEPVLSRASSVRVQRPQLVEHNPNASGYSLRVYGTPLGSPPNPGPSLRKTQQVISSPLNTLRDLTPQAQRANPNDTRPGPLISKAEQLLGIPLKNLTDLTPAVGQEDPVDSLGGPAEALEALTANALNRASTTALAPTPPPLSELSHTPASITETTNTPSRIEAQSTHPLSMSGFHTRYMPHHHLLESENIEGQHTGSLIHEASATDGLRSNPIQPPDVPRLHRAISAPPLSSRHPHRRVTIRPLDLESAGEYRLRQSVVSTPYPTRAGSLDVDAISPLSAIAYTKVSQALPPTSEVRDRFRSPLRTEVLHLELAVARRPSITTLVKITIEDRSTYDDEALFKVLRRSYTHILLGPSQYLVTARVLRSVTFTDPLFDATSFLQHLLSPRLGHKRKTWLVWLREHQVKPILGSSIGSEKSVSFHSPASTSRMPFFKMHKVHPRLTFHFDFSLPKIALAIIGNILMSCLAAILWVLFGVPGVGLEQRHHKLAMPVNKWQLDAQERVETGLVLGVFVALLGTLGSVGWIAGSWLLL
jgi:hypothetical protein